MDEIRTYASLSLCMTTRVRMSVMGSISPVAVIFGVEFTLTECARRSTLCEKVGN